MATVNLGSIKFKWKGTYSGATAYTIDDVVEYNGSSYICILASTGNLPTNATYFEQMSAKGADGTNGTNGTNGTDVGTVITTQGDLLYRDGSGLQRLGAGANGQVLTSGGAGANPSWGTVSSDFVKISSGTQTGSSSLIFNNLDNSTYKQFKIILNNLISENTGYAVGYFRLRYNNSGTQTSFTNSSYTYRFFGKHVFTGTGDTGESSGVGYSDQVRWNWQISRSGASNQVQTAEFDLYDLGNTSYGKVIRTRNGGHGDDGSLYGFFIDGYAFVDDNQAFNGIQIYSGGGQNFHCNYIVYGIK